MIRSIRPHDEKRQKKLQQLLVTWLIADSCSLIIVQNGKRLREINLTNSEWELIKELLQVLGLFEE
ncbi:14892_t:CDS:2, partial [Dentiscutata erythropus]